MSLEQYSRNRYDRQRAACDVAFASNEWLPKVELVSLADKPDIAHYAAVGKQLYEGFAQHHLHGKTTSLPPTVIMHGFVMTGRGIGRCVEGYQHFYDNNPTATPEPSKAALEAALVNPQTVRFFTFIAQMRIEKNNKYEGPLRLLDDKALKDPSFRYDPGTAAFLPDEAIKQAAGKEATEWAAKQGFEQTATDKAPHVCPATKYIPAVWEMTVEACNQAGLLDVAEFCRPQVSSLPLDLTKL